MLARIGAQIDQISAQKVVTFPIGFSDRIVWYPFYYFSGQVHAFVITSYSIHYTKLYENLIMPRCRVLKFTSELKIHLMIMDPICTGPRSDGAVNFPHRIPSLLSVWALNTITPSSFKQNKAQAFHPIYIV